MVDADFIKFDIYQLDYDLTKPYRETSMLSFGTAHHGIIKEKIFKTFTDGYLAFDKAAELIEGIRKTRKPFFTTTISSQEIDFLIEQGSARSSYPRGKSTTIPSSTTRPSAASLYSWTRRRHSCGKSSAHMKSSRSPAYFTTP